MITAEIANVILGFGIFILTFVVMLVVVILQIIKK